MDLERYFMKRNIIPIVISILVSFALIACHSHKSQASVQVELQTSMGAIRIELDPDKAPRTVDNFLAYVRDGHYDGTIFHRVIKGFMIQGGGLTENMQPKETRPPIPNEADNGLKNTVGTIAMARTQAPHSATSQFFINVNDNHFLDFKEKSPSKWGYCVFGKVIKGMDVVRAIENIPTTTRDGRGDVPVKPVVIESARIIAAAQSK